MIEKEYKKLNIRIGLTLILHFVLTYFLLWQGGSIMYFFGFDYYGIEASILNSFLYLFCFMMPVLFFRIISRRHPVQDMKLGIKMDAESLLWIPAGVGLILPVAILNNELLSFIDFGKVFSSSKLDSPWAVVLEFIGTALVPAVCEEFLFRGCIESNLMPYGKQSAIFLSAFFFAMMHGNIVQFLYTFCAGLILGYVFAETGSIWPGMFIHLINNFVSSVEEVYVQNLERYTADLIYSLMDTVLFVAGLAALVIIIIRKKGKLLSPDEARISPELSAGRMKMIFNPATIVYVALCVYDAVRIVVYTFLI